tara:strand:- start:124 stop:843 length:720 start_codon:yes stop_codon:yes gene_type:complete
MNSKKNIAIEAATDGACSGNPGSGGWGAIIIFDDGSELEFGGAEKNTTNNRMELTAAIRTIEKLKDFELKKNFKLRTDSKYVIEGYTNWINNWKKNGWKTSSGKIVQNLDLWQKIDKLRISGLYMEFVKGHNGDLYNERVDKIATNYSKGISINSGTANNIFLRDKEDLSPINIKQLFLRLDLVNQFAKKGFLLNSQELCDLLSIRQNESIKKLEEFEWRNWKIKPIKDNLWQIIDREK